VKSGNSDNHTLRKDSRRKPMARVPSVARGTIFNGTLSKLKYSNYDLIKKIEFLIQ
jgi:hypothetical protein